MKSDRPAPPKRETPFDDVPTPRRRKSHLAALKAWKMALDAHAFVRASAGLFYEALGDGLAAQLPMTEPIWISGDCHGENLGAMADAGGVVRLEPNDLDETVVGSAAHDVLRLALDVTVAARSFEAQRGPATVALVAELLEGYVEALRAAPSSRGRDEPPGPLRKLVRRTAEQTRTDLLDKRVPRGSDGKRRFVHGARYFPLSDAERAAVEALVARDEVRALVAAFDHDAPELPLEVLDVAFRVAGTGSLGCFRAAALVRVGDGRKEGDARLRLLDVKEALPSTATRHPDGVMPTDDAERVVRGARALVPAFGDRMLAASTGGRRVVVRELSPQDRKVELSMLEDGEAAPIARHLGAVVGRAHARQLSSDAALDWAARVASKASGRPPSWLWEALVRLVGVHEEAYLRHCGEFATAHPSLR